MPVFTKDTISKNRKKTYTSFFKISPKNIFPKALSALKADLEVK
jgi:hypothetical protein